MRSPKLLDDSLRGQGSNARKLQTGPANIPSPAAGLIDWYLKNARPLPWRNRSDPYAIWVSEVMLQQTQVKTVIAYWERWMRELPTIQALADAKPDRALKLWEGLGYYRRVRNMQRAAQQIVALHHGEFPDDYASIIELPGIGRYTAGAICSIAFDQPAPILDGNVMRVLARVHGISSSLKEPKTSKRLWRLAAEWVSQAHSLGKGSCSALNQGLMELGATVCVPRAPRCELCPLRVSCAALRTKRVEQIPAISSRAAVTRENRIAFVIEDQRGRTLVRQRSAGLVNAGLWEFPNELSAPGLSADRAFQNWCGVESRAGISNLPGKPILRARLISAEILSVNFLLKIEHSITRYRITMNVHRIRIGKLEKLLSSKTDFVAHPIARLHELAFPSAHRRIARRLQHLSFESGRVGLSKK